ncbi:KTSC domain-containing protein [Hymenobacter rigui]|uniref:KTSC domain-containing protein n=1 Tax=Hymenobacter rigui TaxID=334424 RepID=A0A3R9P6L2_9BACT|nr:KTSC domain-containing protein [Hymenobacter rigui]
MQRRPVRSTSLKAVGYEAATQTLEIEYRHGGLVRYTGVPAAIHAALLQLYPTSSCSWSRCWNATTTGENSCAGSGSAPNSATGTPPTRCAARPRWRYGWPARSALRGCCRRGRPEWSTPGPADSLVFSTQQSRAPCTAK